MKRRTITGLIVLVLALLLTAGAAMAQTVTREWVEENYRKTETYISMRDGIRLHTTLYEPRDGGEHPVILLRTPYGLAPYGDRFSGTLTSWMSVFAANRYIIVFQSVRGTYLSEGKYVNIRPLKAPEAPWDETDEATDTYDTAEWLMDHTRCSGSIGVKGVSYPGFYATMAAFSGHPAVKAVSPQAPVTDWWKGDDIHHNGIPMLDIYGFAGSFFRERPEPAPHGNEPLIRYDKNIYSYFLERPDFPSLTQNFGERIPYWETILSHPDYDEYWKSVSVSRQIRDIAPAVMVVGGSYDAEDCYGAIETYRAVRERSPRTEAYFVYGPWSHGGWRDLKYTGLGDSYFGEGSTEYFLKEIEYPFFAWYLEGKGVRPAAVRILPSRALNGKEVHPTAPDWQTLDTWPAAEAVLQRYYLDRGTLLGPSGAPMVLRSRKYVSDPSAPVPYLNPAKITDGNNKNYMAADQRFAAKRKDVLTYVSNPLKAPLLAEGPVRVCLDVAVSTTDADFFVKLIDVRPDGYQMLVRGDGMRARYRKGGDVPEALVPGEKTRIEWTLNDIAHLFEAGHKIMVQVQSSCFPVMAMSPQFFQQNPYEVPFSDYRKAEITVYNDSWIEIPIMQ